MGVGVRAAGVAGDPTRGAAQQGAGEQDKWPHDPPSGLCGKVPQTAMQRLNLEFGAEEVFARAHAGGTDES
jgi:hypothetical protein